ncbi:hypothetical protein F5878DRAFT_664072 [Lentinula raphanica]|uniref:Uncharacterized protein n=1 Tax=Lentinula raphanica TaxID=153919 RepID=A0AA38P301_9AGAR|nr:hypothetical protein F5878DRAFT_664072 [Lentinula raphanica]
MTTTILASSPQITYSSNWKRNNSDGGMFTNVAGETANLTFQGSFIQVFGTLPATTIGTILPTSSYTLDDGTPAVFDAAEFEDELEADNAIFYHSDPTLSNGIHSLSIQLENNDAQLYITNMVISSPLIEQMASSTHNSAGVGVIVGATVGSLALLVGLVTFFLVRRRRKNRNAQHLRNIRAIQPFVSEFLVPPRRTKKNGTPNFDLESVRSLSVSASNFGEHRQSDGTLFTSMTSQIGPPPSYTTNPRS